MWMFPEGILLCGPVSLWPSKVAGPNLVMLRDRVETQMKFTFTLPGTSVCSSPGSASVKLLGMDGMELTLVEKKKNSNSDAEWGRLVTADS